ncbi:MAG: HAD-IA family hydrolase [Pseudomonadota bacterium]
MNKCIYLVDVDGVIVTGRPSDCAPWWTDLETTFGFDKTALHAQFFPPYWHDIVRGRNALLPCLETALNRMGVRTDAITLRDFWFANDAYIDRDVCSWMDARRAAGHRVMLATNQDHSRGAYLLDELRLCDHCDGAYISAALGAAKPEKAFFEAIMSAEGRAAHDLVLIDDSPANVDAAKSLGWKAHHYTGQAPSVFNQ